MGMGTCGFCGYQNPCSLASRVHSFGWQRRWTFQRALMIGTSPNNCRVVCRMCGLSCFLFSHLTRCPHADTVNIIITQVVNKTLQHGHDLASREDEVSRVRPTTQKLVSFNKRRALHLRTRNQPPCLLTREKLQRDQLADRGGQDAMSMYLVHNY
jgi:hypothetical protein